MQIGLLIAILGAAAFGDFHKTADAKPVQATWPVVQVAQTLMPSVVGIMSYQGVPDGPTMPRGAGTGVIIRSDGYIVTNDHVVAHATQVKVTLASGKILAAQVVGEDPLTDLAVLKIPQKGLTAVRFIPEKDVRVGELAIAIGNPMGPGFARTVTVGVVSGLKRTLGTGYAQRAYDLIQTDAAINPGNSGGPLVDSSGAVIGINSVKVALPGFESMGFAIPSDTVQAVADAIIQSGRVIRPWIGLAVLGPDTARRLGYPLKTGLLVQEVYPGGPGQKAGLQAGDVIVRVNGAPMSGLSDLYRSLSQEKVGGAVRLEVRRGAALLTLKVNLQDMPSGETPARAAQVPVIP